MAIWTFPLKSINGSNMYSDKDFRRFYANIFSSGIIPNLDLEGNLSLQVLQTETPSMNIRVGPGVDMINGGHIMNTAIKEFPIPAPLTTQERIDCIVAQWNDSTNSGDIIYKKNTTQIVRSQDIWEHKLAEIVVPANATSISQANITDTRANPDVCGYSSPFEKIDVGDLAAQFKALTDEYNLEFQAWFENLKNQLDDNQAANLQNQIDTINGVIVQKNIPDGANLDEYKAEGEFSKKTPTIVVGAPEGVTGAFRLSVRTMLGSSGIFQTLYDYVTRSMYYRIGNTTLGFNLPWKRVATTDDIKELTAGDTDGFLPLTMDKGFTANQAEYCIKNGWIYITVQGARPNSTVTGESYYTFLTLPAEITAHITHNEGFMWSNFQGGGTTYSGGILSNGQVQLYLSPKTNSLASNHRFSFNMTIPLRKTK
ncbi:pyocin knob domain-containing protein [Lactococcus petauri]|uniref:pyocin knob domain-containing protein n=1 Tax=Lactococcus petauri TaxID=1940789 RepID=UPI003852F32A